MSQPKIPIPTIEEIVDANAYEARMHFLYADGCTFGRYITQPGIVSKPTAEAAQSELPLDQFAGHLLWVDFTEPEVIGTIESPHGTLYQTISHKAGELAVTTYPNELRSYKDVLLDETEPNSFTKFWIGGYAMDTARNFFGQKYHPLDDIYELYKRTGTEQGLRAVRLRAEAERWDDRIDVREVFVAELARAAMRDFPDMFKNQQPLEYNERFR